jgi:hypothetical protein
VKEIVIRSQNKESPVIGVRSLQRTQQSMFLPPPNLRMATDSFSETSCFLKYRTMDKLKNPLIPGENFRFPEKYIFIVMHILVLN